MPECTQCKKDKNLLDHVRTFMRRMYGYDHCIRKGCEDPIGAHSGYCSTHQAEWLAQEHHRNFNNVTQTSQGSETSKKCAKCSEPAVSTSGYCIVHRREYNRARYLLLKKSILRSERII